MTPVHALGALVIQAVPANKNETRAVDLSRSYVISILSSSESEPCADRSAECSHGAARALGDNFKNSFDV